MKKICKKNQIVTKNTFFAYKMKYIDVWKKIRYKKDKNSKYLQNEMWYIKIDLLGLTAILTFCI